MTALSNSVSLPPRDLVVTFLEDHPKSIILLFTAAKRAQEIKGRWRAVYIETTSRNKTSKTNERMLNLLTRAKQMGAETEHFEAMSLTQGMQQFFAREGDHLGVVVIGSQKPDHWLYRWRKMPWVKMVQLASRCAKVEVVPLTGQFRQPLSAKMMKWLEELEPMHLVYALSGVAVPCLITLFLQKILPPALFRINEHNIDIIFIIASAFIAGRYGLIPGLVTAITSFFVDNYYFSLPYHMLKLRSLTDLFNMGLFLSSALLISLFTSRMRGYVQTISKREMMTEMLFVLYRLTSESYTRQQAMEILQKNLEHMLDADIAFFMPSLINPKAMDVACPTALFLEDNDRKALTSCWADMKSTGAASPYNPGTEWRFEPIIFTNGDIGVLGARPRHRNQLSAWFGRLLSATADQTAAILTHIELERSMETSHINEEREKLRSMLLSSVSHDFKTPLAGIIGSLSAYQALGDRMSPQKRAELVAGSLEEARRLDSFISNILDMTRLEGGNIRFRQEWHKLKEFMKTVTDRFEHPLKKRALAVHLPNRDIEIFLDDVMTGQVLQNLVDNACKYAPENTSVEIGWYPEEDGGITCQVRDHGSGIPQEKLELIFDKYARLQQKDSQVAGTGLGLAIAKAIIEAQGGWIRADNHPEGGAVFSFYLPQWRYVSPQSQVLTYVARK
jgi:two-component system sensor histidine kinase KdpD